MNFSKMNNHELLVAWIEMMEPIKTRVTSDRIKGDTVPIEYDYYSNVTENLFAVGDGVRVLERKRIGVNGFHDMHWIGFISPEERVSRSGEKVTEPVAFGIWLVDKKNKLT